MKTAMILAATVLLAATGASAQTNSTMTKPTTPATKPKAAMSATPAMKTAMPATKTAAPAGPGRMVSTTTKTGKKITYDCSKKGNANKTACKG